jgi:hypothetical protein
VSVTNKKYRGADQQISSAYQTNIKTQSTNNKLLVCKTLRRISVRFFLTGREAKRTSALTTLKILSNKNSIGDRRFHPVVRARRYAKRPTLCTAT